MKSSATLLVLLRGVAFRAGGRSHWSSAKETFVNQMAAMRSIDTYVLRPAALSKWHCKIAADVVVPAHLESLWQHVTAVLSAPLTAQRVTPKHLGSSQVASIASSMKWAAHLLEGAGALLLMRVDLMLQSELPICHVGHCERLRVPFDMCEKDDEGHLTRSVSDVIIWIPAVLFDRFDAMLHRPEVLRSNSLHSLHWLLGRDAIEMMLPGFQGETNTDTDWNPLFYILGREHATLEHRMEMLRMDPTLYGPCDNSSGLVDVGAVHYFGY